MSELQQLLDEVKKTSAAIEEVKASGKAADEVKGLVSELEKKQADIGAQYLALEQKLTEMELEAKRFQAGAASKPEVKSLGGEFVKSDVFKSMANGAINNTPVEVKDITSLSTSAGALVRPDRDPEVYRTVGGMRPLRVRDLISSIPTSSNSVEIMRMKTVTNNAAPQSAEFAAKAQSNYVWELVTVPVRTIAHWVPASRQVLTDSAQLSGLINTELTYGLQLESDAQLLFGDGTGANLSGIMNDAAINDVGQITAGTAAADVPAAMIAKIREAKTACQLNEYYNINGLVLNPEDFETLETAKATDGHYLLVSFAATATTPEAIWRIPVVISNAMTKGNFLLGDWSIGAKVYDREAVSVRVSESHSDYFVKNGVAILGEERYCLAVNRPKAFAKGQFTVAA